MHTRKATLLDTAKLIDIFSEDVILDWVNLARENPTALSVVTVHQKKITIAVLCLLNPHDGQIAIMGLWYGSSGTKEVQYVLDKAVQLYRNAGFEPKNFNIVWEVDSELMKQLQAQSVATIYVVPIQEKDVTN